MNGVQRRTAAGAVCLVGLLGLAAWGIAATQREQSSDTAFTYRGRLTNAGVAATETVDLEFRLFAQPEGGKPIGALARENVALNEGWFSVDLDFGVNTADGEARFLEIGVRPSGSDKDSVTLAPRQPLGLPLRAWEYPYALYGGESAKATGAPTQAARAEVAPEAVGDWNLSGNAGISSDTNFLGTTDDRPLNFRVNNERAFRLEPGYSPNVVGGYSGNSVRADVNGATIAGGGIPGGSENSVKSDYGFVGGGYANTVGDDAEWTYLNICAVVCGG
ncbi:MAG: hypothetical protein NTW86_23380, partial [Candidatus Sumerlaeota bacterium]|nr:hypothetical protein [Candidatus Sumerlaeota bacterium]